MAERSEEETKMTDRNINTRFTNALTSDPRSTRSKQKVFEVQLSHGPFILFKLELEKLLPQFTWARQHVFNLMWGLFTGHLLPPPPLGASEERLISVGSTPLRWTDGTV